jgi:putative ABC transport system permease protein
VIDVAVAELTRAPAKTALRVLALGAAMSVTLLFEGFSVGVDQQMATPAGSLPATLVILEAGAKHLIGIRSNLPQSARADVERIPGVAATHPLVSVPVIFVHGGRRTPIQLMAYDTAGGPRIQAGRAIAGAREIVLDQRLARVHGIGPGDRIKLFDRELAIVGLSTGTDVSFSPLGFVTYDELIDLYLEAKVPGTMGGAPILSFLLVDLAAGADAVAVRRRIEDTIPAVDVHTPGELAALDVALGHQIYGSVLRLLLAVAWIAMVLAVGLTMYADIIDRRRDFGVMKALGVGPLGLARLVLSESLLVLVLAFPLALLLARGAGLAVESLSPLYRVLPWQGASIARGALAALLAGLGGALLPLRRLGALEPDVVFRA